MDHMSNKFGLPESLLDAVKKIQTEETEYQMKVKALMKKKGITSLGQLSPDEKKAFFSQLDAMHQAKHEEVKPDVAKSFPASGVKKHTAPKGVSTMPKDKEKAKGQPAGSLRKEDIELDEGKVKELMMDISDVASKMRKNKMLKPFADKFVTAAKKSLDIKKSLEDVLPDYVSGAEISKLYTEEVELEEGKSGTGYELYHKDFSSAMAHAYDFAKKKYGIEVDPQEIDRNVAMGPKKPSSGKANAYRLLDKTGKKAIQVQVTNLDNKRYELNMYKEDLDEERDPPFTPDKPKKNPGVVPGKHGTGPSVAKHLAKMAMKKQQEKKSMKEEEELDEGMSSAQITKLRQEYEKIGKIDPASDNYKKLTAMLDKLDTKNLQQLAGAKIKFVSSLAQNRVVRRMNEEEALEESGGPVVWKKGNDHIEKYGDEKFALYKDGKKTKYYKSMDDAKAALEEAKDEGASKKKETEFHTKLDKLVHKTFGKSPDEKKMKEASSPAQQAAIAIAMKKAGKKPKDMQEAEGSGTTMGQAKRAAISMQLAQLKMKHQKEREALQKKRKAITDETQIEEEKVTKDKKEATGKEKPVKSGEKLSGKQEVITVNPEVDEKK